MFNINFSQDIRNKGELWLYILKKNVLINKIQILQTSQLQNS